MKLKKLIIAEIVLVTVILVVALIVIEGIPYLEGSQQTSSVNMYQEKEYDKGSITLAKGQTAQTGFNYSTYAPAILVLEISFETWESPGNLTFYCNYESFGSIIATPDKPTISLTMMSLSGVDWVKTTSPIVRPSVPSEYGNEITFSSEAPNGYAGTFNYRISIRGST